MVNYVNIEITKPDSLDLSYLHTFELPKGFVENSNEATI